MNDPVRLDQFREVARFDPGRLEELCREKGEVQAESEAAMALGEIGEILRDLTPADHGLHDAVVARRIDRLADAADRIGMSTLARVAADVRSCIDCGDVVAYAATLARLYRVGDRSIHAIFDLDDQIV
ncbi:MAG: hypothetical protein AAGA70_16350 [Pseudomonadota bacterium]